MSAIFARELVREELDRRERRAVRHRVHGRDPAGREIAPQSPPDAGVAADAVQEQHGQVGGRRRRIAQQHGRASSAAATARGSRTRCRTAAASADNESATSAGARRPPPPAERHPDAREEERQREVGERRSQHERPQRRAVPHGRGGPPRIGGEDADDRRSQCDGGPHARDDTGRGARMRVPRAVSRRRCPGRRRASCGSD